MDVKEEELEGVRLCGRDGVVGCVGNGDRLTGGCEACCNKCVGGLQGIEVGVAVVEGIGVV